MVVRGRRKYQRLWYVATGLVFVGVLALLFRPDSPGVFWAYANKHTLKTGVEFKKGAGQIYYEYGGKRHFVTDDDRNHVAPRASGLYLTWLDETNGQYQVVLYDLQAKQRLALSVVGNNTSPSQDHRYVAWQTIVNDQTVIYFFNGISVKQISGKYAAIRANVKGKKVLYAQQLDVRRGMWQTVLYDDATGQSTVVAQGSAAQAAWPRFEGNVIKTSLKNSSKYYD